MATTSSLTPSSSPAAMAARPAVQLNYGQLPDSSEFSELPPWQRPADWLELPQIAAGEQKVVGLFAVFPGEGNVLALQAAGNYCVDWGDGTSEQVSSPGQTIHRYQQWFGNNFYGPLDRFLLVYDSDPHWNDRIEGSLFIYLNDSLLSPDSYTLQPNSSLSGTDVVLSTPVPDGVHANIQACWDWSETITEPVRIEHRYDYSSISADTACSRGYRQVIVTITPQPGADLTLVDLSPRHSSIGLGHVSCPWLDLAISLPKAAAGASLVLCGYASRSTSDYLGSVERIVIHDAGGATDLAWLLHNAYALRHFRLEKAEAVETIDRICHFCTSLDQIDLPPLPALNSASTLLYGCNALREFRLHGLASLTSLDEACQEARALERVWIEDAPQLQSAEGLFYGCLALQEVTISGATQLANLNRMFQGCSALITAPALDTTAATSMASMFEDCRALREVPLYDTAQVTTMEAMFSGCWALRQLPPFSTPAVAVLDRMLAGCHSLLSLPLLDTTAVTSMGSVFQGCSALQALPPLQVGSVSDFGDALAGCAVLAATPLQGIRSSLSLWGCNLSRSALVQLFQGLAVVEGNPELNIGMNWGVAELAPEDFAIATAKGWTLLF